MTSKVFVHIGSHKTGTTAIQDFAASNDALLRQSGLLYPSYDLIGAQRTRSHLGLVADLSGQKEEPRRAAQAVLHAASTVSSRDNLNILISAESLFRATDAAADKVCSALVEAFPTSEFVVVAALRPVLEFAESLYRNGFRAYQRRPPPFREWLQTSVERCNYRKAVDRISAPLSAELSLIPYSRTTRPVFIETFFEGLGSPVRSNASSARIKNPSLDVIDCLAKWQVMGSGTDPVLSRAFNNFAFKAPLNTDYLFIDSDSAQFIKDSVGKENQGLSDVEPSLTSILGEDSFCPQGRPIDEPCNILASERAATFAKGRSRF